MQLEAARQAMARFDLDLAERLARSARGTSADAEAGLLLARILQFRGRGDEAAAALPAAPDGPTQRAVWADTRALILYWGLGRAEEAERALAPAVATEPWNDEAEASRSWILLFDGRCRSALRLARTVMDRPGAGEQAVIWAAMAGAAAAGLLGRLDVALAIADRGQAVAEAAAERFPWGPAQVGYGRCLALYATGHLAQAADTAEAGYRTAAEKDAAMMVGLWAGFQGTVAKARGRPVEAQAALREAVALMEDNDTYHIGRVHLAELAGACALGGDRREAERYQARSDALRNGSNRLFEPWVELDRAWTVAAGGALSHARELAIGAADLARVTEQPTIEAACLYDAVRLGDATVRSRLGWGCSPRAGRGVARADPGGCRRGTVHAGR